MATTRPETYGQLRYPRILFGDNEFGILVAERPVEKTKKGIPLKPYLFVPHEHLVRTYPYLHHSLTEKWEDTPQGSAIWRSYPVDWIVDSPTQLGNPIIRVDCTFEGKESPLTKRVHKFKHDLEWLQAERERLLVKIHNLEAENEKLVGDIEDYAKHISEMNRLMKVVKDESHEDDVPER